MNQENSPKNSGKLWIWIILVVLLLLVIGVGIAFFLNQNKKSGTEESSNQNTSQTQAESWKSGGVAIAGKYADADVIALDDGSYRMFYAAEPEIVNFNAQVYSATSSDGKTWKEEGEIRQGATFPDVIKLPDGRWRMYFQNNQVIKSAVSQDGKIFTDEDGIRIDTIETGYEISNVAASSTIILADGSYMMVYRGLIDKPYSTTEKLPNQTTGLFFYATSSDGLTWQKKGLALDSRNETLKGMIDGPDFATWDDGSTRLYFWSYKGVYHINYQNNQFTSQPVFDYTNNTDSKVQFPQDPPGDPTLIQIAEKWFMYYGQHEKGIYYTSLN